MCSVCGYEDNDNTFYIQMLKCWYGSLQDWRFWHPKLEGHTPLVSPARYIYNRRHVTTLDGKKFNWGEHLRDYVKAKHRTPEIESGRQGREATEPSSKVFTQASDLHLTCRTCGKTFGRSESLMYHFKTTYHTPEIGPKLPKPDGDAAAKSRSGQLTCGTCGWGFIMREELMRHVEYWNHTPRIPREHYEPDRDPYLNCWTCGRDFTKREHPLRHAELKVTFRGTVNNRSRPV
ncbi:hypothetical protein F5B21DRAFT_521810 [Xylaria acuta]|nr:hypothetical protein F5B21DRAFT_521810 [Xylaria acuta]